MGTKWITSAALLLTLACSALASQAFNERPSAAGLGVPDSVLQLLPPTTRAAEEGPRPDLGPQEFGALSGTVTDTLGAPIQYATVIVEGAMMGSYTSAAGKYSIAKVPPGRYTISARVAGYLPSRSADVRVDGGETTVLDFVLRPGPVRPRRLSLIRSADAAILADPDVRLLARDARRFAVDLYGRIAPVRGNLFFSPWSIRTALGMAYAGASGRTEEQMATALHDSLGQLAIHVATSLLDSLLRAAGASVGPTDLELRIAQATWLARDIRLRAGFTDTLRLRYGARPELLDFAQGEKARANINTWAEDQTHARIRDLIPPGAIDRWTRLVLCDAIYFWGAWQDSFPSLQTAEAPFHLTAHDTVPVPFMHSSRTAGYFENRDVQVLELPYVGGDIAMRILLPRAEDGLEALEARLDPDSVTGWAGQLRNAHVRLALPKFRVEQEFRLARPLGEMGMGGAFARDADFSGIADERPLFISDVFHKAFVAVNEHGTEASAASAVVVTKGAIMVPPGTVDFTADHPFLFLICHRPSGAILFMGRLADPR